MTTRAGVLTVALLALAAPAGAQDGVRLASGGVLRSFSLDDKLAASSASLLLVPVAVDIPFGRAFTLELYGAYANGTVERGDETLELTGPINANVRALWSAAPWARVSLGVSVPTGGESLDPEESTVAAILSTDLLGFREGSFGAGGAVTTGVAFAHQLGPWGFGWGGSYRLAQDFEPFADSAATYAPGNQLMLRLAADRNFGRGAKLTVGASWQHFAEDEFETNLFRPGSRVRADAAYAFRTGASSTWSLFVTDIWREQSDALTDSGSVAIAGSQNVLVVGTVGSLDLGSVRLVPRADVRLLSRQDGIASGWLGSAGLGVPVRLGSFELLPRGQAMFGAIAADGDRPGISGFEAELTLRWGAGG